MTVPPMLNLLKIRNFALIAELTIEFGEGLNLLTGETGSGKSIIVDSLGALTGARISSDLIKHGEETAEIEGLFTVKADTDLSKILGESGIEAETKNETELVIRRELSIRGRNRVFVNDRLVTQGFLKKIGTALVDIHGQGEHTTLFNTASHLEILDKYADTKPECGEIYQVFGEMRTAVNRLSDLESDEAEKLQLIDILTFQIDEIAKANIENPDEEQILDAEKRKLNNAEKLSQLSNEAFLFLYDGEESVTENLEKVTRRVGDLSEFESAFGEYQEGLDSAKAVLEDLALALRDFRDTVEFSTERLEEIENRLAEFSGLKRKYGGTIENVLSHYRESSRRLENIESAETKKIKLRKELKLLREKYLVIAKILSEKRTKAAKKFELDVIKNLKDVALDKAQFEVRIENPSADELENGKYLKPFSTTGIDAVEFYFSANPGEKPKPLAKVASGGEASRLMLVLKTTAGADDAKNAAVFDEVDAGIGGRVAEAVGKKLKELSKLQQVLCVTHQPQVAAQADRHYAVDKSVSRGKTYLAVRDLNESERIEEIAKMLAGEQVTETARKHARELLSGTRSKGKGTV